MSLRAIIDIVVQNQNGIKTVNTDLQNLNNTVNRNTQSFDRMGKGISTALKALLGGEILRRGINQFGELNKAQAQLNVNIERNINLTKNSAKAFSDYNAQIAANTRLTEANLIAIESQLSTLNLTESQIISITGAISELSNQGIDFKDSLTQITQAIRFNGKLDIGSIFASNADEAIKKLEELSKRGNSFVNQNNFVILGQKLLDLFGQIGNTLNSLFGPLLSTISTLIASTTKGLSNITTFLQSNPLLSRVASFAAGGVGLLIAAAKIESSIIKLSTLLGGSSLVSGGANALGGLFGGLFVGLGAQLRKAINQFTQPIVAGLVSPIANVFDRIRGLFAAFQDAKRTGTSVDTYSKAYLYGRTILGSKPNKNLEFNVPGRDISANFGAGEGGIGLIGAAVGSVNIFKGILSSIGTILAPIITIFSKLATVLSVIAVIVIPLVAAFKLFEGALSAFNIDIEKTVTNTISKIKEVVVYASEAFADTFESIGKSIGEFVKGKGFNFYDNLAKIQEKRILEEEKKRNEELEKKRVNVQKYSPTNKESFSLLQGYLSKGQIPIADGFRDFNIEIQTSNLEIQRLEKELEKLKDVEYPIDTIQQVQDNEIALLQSKLEIQRKIKDELLAQRDIVANDLLNILKQELEVAQKQFDVFNSKDNYEALEKARNAYMDQLDIVSNIKKEQLDVESSIIDIEKTIISTNAAQRDYNIELNKQQQTLIKQLEIDKFNFENKQSQITLIQGEIDLQNKILEYRKNGVELTKQEIDEYRRRYELTAKIQEVEAQINLNKSIGATLKSNEELRILNQGFNLGDNESVKQAREQQIAALRAEILLLKDKQALLRQISQDSQENQVAINETEIAINDLNKAIIELNRSGTLLSDVFESNMNSAFDSIITGSKSVSEAFSNLANSILVDITRIIARAAISNIATSLLGATGFFGAFSGGFGSFVSGIQNSPTLPNAGITRAQGGFVGGPLGAGDIVPAMLSPGELVLNRAQQTRLASNLSNNKPASPTIYNLIDPQDITRIMSRPQGRNVIINNISMDRLKINRLTTGGLNGV